MSSEITDLKSLDDELAKNFMRGLWAREETMRREPAPFGKPILWKWSKIRAGLEAAGRLIGTNYKGARRAISSVATRMGESGLRNSWFRRATKSSFMRLACSVCQ